MTLARRLAAAILAVVLAGFPLALERCRTACAGATAPAASTPSHGCHDMGDDESVPSAAPVPPACGHGNDARVSETTGLAPAKLRAASVADIGRSSPVTAVGLLQTPVGATPSPFASVFVPLNVPLRV